MSTPNFRTQKDFDLYCYDEWDISQEQIDDMREANEYSEDISDDKIKEWIADDNVTFLQEDFPYALKECQEELKRELNFFNVTLRSGYYGGVQLYVELSKDLRNFGNTVDEVMKYIDNEDTKYYFDMRRSEFQKKFFSEHLFLNRRFLPLLAKKTGFKKYNCIGVFSNGEAIYELA